MSSEILSCANVSASLYSVYTSMSAWGSAAVLSIYTSAEIAFSVIRGPRNAVSASFDLIGVNPTQPSTIAASLHTSPSIVSRTAALAVGYTGAERLNARYAPPLALGGTLIMTSLSTSSGNRAVV